jgi:hypothetical protein
MCAPRQTDVALPSLSGARPWQRRTGLSTKGREFLDDRRERLCRVDLVRARLAQQRFYLGKVTKNKFALLRRLAVDVRRPALDPAQEHVGRSPQQDDSVEA